MGAKVQFDNYYSMRDLNHDSNGTSWPLHHGEHNLPNGQFHYNVLPRPTPELFPGVDKELVKQKMLEHETVFRSQVFELHRLYKVQKDLMDEIRKKEQYNHRIPFETSSSSSPLPPQMTREDAHSHRQHSSSFLYTNGVCGAPPASDLEYIRSSADGSLTGKSPQCGPILSQNCASPKNSEVSESRPSKWRKMIDLQLPPDEYIDPDEVEQFGNSMTNHSGEKSFPSRVENTKCALADLNEPLEPEESNCFQNHDLLTKVPAISEAVSQKPEHGRIDETRSSLHYNDKVNRQNWFLSASKPEGSKEQGKLYHHFNHSEKASLLSRPQQIVFENQHQSTGAFPPLHVKENSWQANDSFKMLDKSHSHSGYSNLEGFVASHPPSYAPSSHLANSWDISWRKPSNNPNQRSTAVHMNPFNDSAGLSKVSQPQSSAPSNGFLEPWWCRNDKPRSNLGFGGETPIRNGFYHGSSSGGYKELPVPFSKAGPGYVNGYSDRVASGSSNFLKGTHFPDLNSTRDLNLNVSDVLSNEPREAKGESSVSVLPWLRTEATKYDAPRSRNSLNKVESRLFDDQHELHSRFHVGSARDHQNPVASTSCNVDAARSGKNILGVPIHEEPLSRDESGKKRVLFDINMPCDDHEEFDNAEVRIENAQPGFRSMIDLNSCVVEDEVLSRASHTNNSSTTATETKKPERGILIDLEAPPDLEGDDDVNCVLDVEPLNSSLQNSTENSDEKLERVVAAEAIIAMSISTIQPQPLEEAEASKDALRWFVDIACGYPDGVDDTECISSDSDSFEEMNLKLTESTVEDHYPKPPNFDVLSMQETGHVNVAGRPRRGAMRRGRPRRDFQRDILPGITSLARHEVTEDLQMFGGLMRATGHAWQSGTRRSSSRNGSGRGRRRAIVAAAPSSPSPPPPPAVNPTVLSPQKQIPKNGEITFEDRSLTSWGKTTRRPRRQRCPPANAGNPAAIPLS